MYIHSRLRTKSDDPTLQVSALHILPSFKNTLIQRIGLRISEWAPDSRCSTAEITASCSPPPLEIVFSSFLELLSMQSLWQSWTGFYNYSYMLKIRPFYLWLWLWLWLWCFCVLDVSKFKIYGKNSNVLRFPVICSILKDDWRQRSSRVTSLMIPSPFGISFFSYQLY